MYVCLFMYLPVCLIHLLLRQSTTHPPNVLCVGPMSFLYHGASSAMFARDMQTSLTTSEINLFESSFGARSLVLI